VFGGVVRAEPKGLRGNGINDDGSEGTLNKSMRGNAQRTAARDLLEH